MFGFDAKELRLLRSLSTPPKIQSFLDTVPINFEPEGDTLYSPRMLLRHRRAHCIEGALFATAALWVNGAEPWVLNLHAVPSDYDHVVALFRRNGLWGAISKSNNCVLRYRDPVYRTPRELALSYFHEYTQISKGKKTLRGFSKPFSLKKMGTAWLTDEEPLWDIAVALHDSPHSPVFPKGTEKILRPPGTFELSCSDISEWKEDGTKTVFPKQLRHKGHI